MLTNLRRMGRLQITWDVGEPLLALALCAVAVYLAFLPPLDSSFWLDETGTMWLTRGDLLSTIGNSYRFQGGSPLYNVIAWVTRSLFGDSETALRMPSLLGILVAAAALYRLGHRLFGRSAGLLAATLFLLFPRVAFAATDARPYALALAGLILSTLFLCRWLDEGRLRDRVLYAVFVAATFYLHYLIALALLAHVPFFVLRRNETPAPRGRTEVLKTLVLIGILLLPLVPNLIHVLGERSVLANPYPRSFVSILRELVPPELVAALVGAAVVAVLAFRNWRFDVPGDTSAYALITAWMVIPFAVIFGSSVTGEPVLLAPRYFFSVAPAIALAFAVVIASMRSRGARWVCAGAGALAFLILWPPASDHTKEPWRTAAAVERSLAGESTPVLLFAGFIEAKQSDWLTDETRASYLTAPATAYEMDGNIFPAPWEITGETDAYLRDLAQHHLTRADRFLLVTRSLDVTKTWLDTNVVPMGYELETTHAWNGEVIIHTYIRTTSAL